MTSYKSVPESFLDEQAEIDQLEVLAEKIGYGRVLQVVKHLWYEKEKQGNPQMDDATAARGSGLVCVWCDTDTRTGRPYKAG